MAHSPIGASSYYRWKACPGSVRLCKNIVSKSSIYAEEGTRAHDIAAKMLMGETFGKIDDEMLAAVEIYVNFVKSLLTKDTQLWIEERFDLSEYYPGLFGTCDAIVHDPRLQKLYVIDYKHGAGISVSAIENLQLMYYGVGALHAKQIPVRTVELIIVQPRCNDNSGGIKRWNTDPMRLTEYIDDLKKDALATADPQAPLNPGDHCRFCPAQPSCPKLQEKSLTLAKSSFSPIEDYEPKKLSEVLTMLPAIEAWTKSVREFAYTEAEAGRVPPGYKLVPKRAYRKWKEMVNDEVISCQFGLKYPEVIEVKLLSPAQIEKLLNKDKVLIERLERYVDKESSGHTLVACADEREAIDTRPRFDPIND